MTNVITKNYFSGGGKAHDASPNGLASIIRGMAIDNARTVIAAVNPTAITDNTTGTASLSVSVPVVASSGVYNAASAGGVSYSALNTSLGKIENAQASWSVTINKLLNKFGLPAIVNAQGTSTGATIPAQDLAATTASGTSAVDHTSYVASISAAQANQASLFQALNSVLKAVGAAPALGSFNGGNVTPGLITRFGNSLVLLNIPAVVASADGTTSVALADGTASLLAMANNFATFGAYFNRMLNFISGYALTDSTGGTASGTSTLALINGAGLVGYQDVSTASLSASAFNAQLVKYQNAFSSIMTAFNDYLDLQGKPLVADPSGGIFNATLAAESITPSAATGATKAHGTFTETSTNNIITGDTFNIGGKVYTFQTSLTNVDGNVLVGSSFAVSMANLVDAVTLGTGSGTLYAAAMTANPQATASFSTTLTATALVGGTAGNSIVTSYTAAGTSAGSWGAATMAGGVNSTAASLVSTQAAFAAVANNVATLAEMLNEYLPDNANLTDNSGGTSEDSLIAIPATVVADNNVAAVGVLNTSAEAVMSVVRNDISTLAASVNSLISTGTAGLPLNVVAG